MKIIEAEGINKFFGTGQNRVHVLKDMSFAIEEGDFVAIIGQSGSGKSTLMNILGCLDTQSSGVCRIGGVDIGTLDSDELAELRGKRIGFIFQRYNLLSTLSATENVALPAVYSGVDKKARLDRAKSLLADLGLPDKLENKPNELSGGQQQRVSIARALMNGGSIILADEPTGALVPDRIRGELRGRPVAEAPQRRQRAGMGIQGHDGRPGSRTAGPRQQRGGHLFRAEIP